MGNSLFACVGGRGKNQTNGVKATGNDGVESELFEEKSLDGSFANRLLEHGSMRRFARQTSANPSSTRNPPANGFTVDDNYYQNPVGTSRGSAIIFAMTEFDDTVKRRFHQPPDRSGVIKDASDLSTILDQSGYDVQVVWNATIDILRRTLKAAVKSEKISSSDSFVCVVLTVTIDQGEEKCLLFHDKAVPHRKLTNSLWKIGSEALTGIPKIIIIESVPIPPPASTPTTLDDSIMATLKRKAKSSGTERKFPPEEPDFLVVQSCSERLVLTQTPRLGSYFVQKLAAVLRLNSMHNARDALSILTLLNENLSMSSTEEDAEKNGIFIASTLRKNFRFFRDETPAPP